MELYIKETVTSRLGRRHLSAYLVVLRETKPLALSRHVDWVKSLLFLGFNAATRHVISFLPEVDWVKYLGHRSLGVVLVRDVTLSRLQKFV